MDATRCQPLYFFFTPVKDPHKKGLDNYSERERMLNSMYSKQEAFGEDLMAMNIALKYTFNLNIYYIFQSPLIYQAYTSPFRNHEIIIECFKLLNM